MGDNKVFDRALTAKRMYKVLTVFLGSKLPLSLIEKISIHSGAEFLGVKVILKESNDFLDPDDFMKFQISLVDEEWKTYRLVSENLKQQIYGSKKDIKEFIVAMGSNGINSMVNFYILQESNDITKKHHRLHVMMLNKNSFIAHLDNMTDDMDKKKMAIPLVLPKSLTVEKKYESLNGKVSVMFSLIHYDIENYTITSKIYDLDSEDSKITIMDVIINGTVKLKEDILVLKDTLPPDTTQFLLQISFMINEKEYMSSFVNLSFLTNDEEDENYNLTHVVNLEIEKAASLFNIINRCYI